jgi:hypothetical protein
MNESRAMEIKWIREEEIKPIHMNLKQ